MGINLEKTGGPYGDQTSNFTVVMDTEFTRGHVGIMLITVEEGKI